MWTQFSSNVQKNVLHRRINQYITPSLNQQHDPPFCRKRVGYLLYLVVVVSVHSQLQLKEVLFLQDTRNRIRAGEGRLSSQRACSWRELKWNFRYVLLEISKSLILHSHGSFMLHSILKSAHIRQFTAFRIPLLCLWLDPWWNGITVSRVRQNNQTYSFTV